MYLWQSPQWPQFTYNASSAQSAVSAARLAQGKLLGVAAGLGLADLGTLQLHGWEQEALATAQMEGEQLELHSVRASAARRLGLAPSSPGKEVRVEATLDVLQAATAQNGQGMGHDLLCAWHAALFPTGYSGVQRIQVGAYRSHTEPMQIVTLQLGKNDIVHYQAPASSDVPAHMDQLIAWLGDPANTTDGVIKAAIAHLWFEAIHPFEDGNGRIGRALAEWVLAQDQRSDQRLLSLSHQLWEARKDYYAQLQAATGSAAMDITPWVLWFVGCFTQACHASLAHVQTAVDKTKFWHHVQATYPALNPSQRKVLNKLYDAQPTGFSNGLATELYAKIAQVSRATAYRELTALTDAGLLVRSGQGRATRYALL